MTTYFIEQRPLLEPRSEHLVTKMPCRTSVRHRNDKSLIEKASKHKTDILLYFEIIDQQQCRDCRVLECLEVPSYFHHISRLRNERR